MFTGRRNSTKNLFRNRKKVKICPSKFKIFCKISFDRAQMPEKLSDNWSSDPLFGNNIVG